MAATRVPIVIDANWVDFGNTLNEYNYSRDGEQADYLALRMDWRATGRDMREAVAAYERETLRLQPGG